MQIKPAQCLNGKTKFRIRVVLLFWFRGSIFSWISSNWRLVLIWNWVLLIAHCLCQFMKHVCVCTEHHVCYYSLFEQRSTFMPRAFYNYMCITSNQLTIHRTSFIHIIFLVTSSTSCIVWSMIQLVLIRFFFFLSIVAHFSLFSLLRFKNDRKKLCNKFYICFSSLLMMLWGQNRTWARKEQRRDWENTLRKILQWNFFKQILSFLNLPRIYFTSNFKFMPHQIVPHTPNTPYTVAYHTVRNLIEKKNVRKIKYLIYLIFSAGGCHSYSA